MHDADYDRCVMALTQLGPVRAWSLLVTVFGDLSENGALDGPTLTSIMNEVGIKPEATRVALHRLRSDGWITSQRSGRTSRYSLTIKGQRDSAAARPRIYGRPEDMGRGAHVYLTAANGNTLDPADYAQIAPRLFISGKGTACPPDAMMLQPTELPAWLGDQMELDYLRDGYDALYSVLSGIVPTATDTTPLQTAVLRVLIVHAWRRLALKHPDLPRAAHSTAWRGHDCRTLVTTLLDRLPRPDHDAIKTA
ncbi:PaaX family transcriptional regulator C-terminal domain-containing protein [Tateyamaria pelophila]|uniref:PaaX family transcriptional regulator C-terminal domain-containing protein n=1 Tax=Tateyamaria pelophila TaxID=328415 RepID=UPI001CBC4378|nr:PaaX family transcriptional regulator C-terminal domain-containing protein [Tateyamaria pelophila]